MELSKLNSGDAAVVTALRCPPAVGERLRALGVGEGNRIALIKVSPFRNMFLLSAAGSRVALRREVASCILVDPV